MQILLTCLFSLVASQKGKGPEAGQYVRFRGARPGSLLSLAPVDGAEFLPKQHFDVSIELHKINSTTEFPDLSGIKATINGKSFEEVLGKSYSPIDTWTFDYAADAESEVNGIRTSVAVSRLSLRSGTIKEPGVYKVSILIGDQSVDAEWTVRSPSERKVKNMILLIGDGMAPSMVAAARILSKESNFGKFGDNTLNMERLGSVGKILTNGLDSVITDSANSAVAYTTGQKGWQESLGVYSDTSASSFDDPKVETIGEYIRSNRPEMCIGVVTTAEVQDATPASVYAHTRNRKDNKEITDQMINGVTGDYPWDPKPVQADVFLGGGGRAFCTGSSNCSTLNNTDYYSAFTALGYTVVKSQAELNEFNGNGPLLGIFSNRHLDTWLDRNVYRENISRNMNSHPDGTSEAAVDQPGLELMTMKAIEIMNERCADGFFLMAEAASVDKAMHGIDYERGLADLLELDRTVNMVQKWASVQSDKTGIIVTADHSQAFDVFGSVDTEYFNKMPEEDEQGNLQLSKRKAIGTYETAGWPSSVIDADGLPTVWSGRFKLAAGKVDTIEHREDFQLKTSVSNTNPLMRIQAIQSNGAIISNPDERGIFYNPTSSSKSSSTVHSLQDVDLYCGGPTEFQANCGKVMDNTELFFIIADGLGLGSNWSKVEITSSIETATTTELVITASAVEETITSAIAESVVSTAQITTFSSTDVPIATSTPIIPGIPAPILSGSIKKNYGVLGLISLFCMIL